MPKILSRLVTEPELLVESVSMARCIMASSSLTRLRLTPPPPSRLFNEILPEMLFATKKVSMGETLSKGLSSMMTTSVSWKELTGSMDTEPIWIRPGIMASSFCNAFSARPVCTCGSCKASHPLPSRVTRKPSILAAMSLFLPVCMACSI